MTWSVIKEIGIDYAPLSGSIDQPQLHFPTYAARSERGDYLIGDELGTEKQIPFRFECRTIRVDAAGTPLFDTAAEGIDDGYGCLLDNDRMAILRRTKWELLIFSPQGVVTDRLGLATLSKRMPRYVSWTSAATFLIVFFNRSYDVEIVEIDGDGRLLWYLPSGAIPLGIAGSIQLTGPNTLLIADPFRHVALEIDRDGHVAWTFGEAGDPARSVSRLSSPSSAKSLPDGGRLIADTRNHRVLSIDQAGTVYPIRPAEGHLCDPHYADVLENGHYLLCDTGNARVVQLDKRGQIVWQYGQTIAERRQLSYPRSVAYTGAGRYLVADTAHDRIVEIDNGQVTERPLQDNAALFWPRCVRELPTGTLLVADARNHRIVEVSRDGRILRQLSQIDASDDRRLQDPHDVRLLRNGHLLITDSPRDVVMEVDWKGAVHKMIGAAETVELDDPHSAQQLEDGSYVISDTGHHRILLVSSDGQCIREIDRIRASGSLLRLHQPRYAEASDDGTLVIADTGNNRILAVNRSGQLIWEFSQVPDSRLPWLNQPRWAQLVNRHEVVICDHFNHRLLHARFDG